MAFTIAKTGIPLWVVVPSTGVPVNADSTPVGTLYIQGVASATVVTIANVTTGLYKISFPSTSVDTFDHVFVYVTYAVGATAQSQIPWQAGMENPYSTVEDMTDDALARFGDRSTGLAEGDLLDDSVILLARSTSGSLSDSLSGPGARRFEWTVLVGATAVVGCAVWVSTDSPYTEANVVAGTKYTDDAGFVYFSLDDDVVYYGWRDSADYNFTDPVQFKYSTSNARWEKWNGAAYVVWT